MVDLKKLGQAVAESRKSKIVPPARRDGRGRPKSTYMTQDQLAELLDVHRVTVLNIENGKHEMSVSNWLRLLEIFPELRKVKYC